MGLDMNNIIAVFFFPAWHEFAKDGAAFRGYREPPSRKLYKETYRNADGKYSEGYQGPYKGYPGRQPPKDFEGDIAKIVGGHRHDQTMASIIAHRLGMNKIHTIGEKGNQFFDNEKKLPKRGSKRSPHPIGQHPPITLEQLAGRTFEPEFKIVTF